MAKGPSICIQYFSMIQLSPAIWINFAHFSAMSLWVGLPLGIVAFLIHSKCANTAKQKQGVKIAHIVKWEPVSSLLLHSLWCNKGGLCVAREDQIWLQQTVRGDHMFCHGQSGRTTFKGDQLKYDRSALSQPCLQHIPCMLV